VLLSKGERLPQWLQDLIPVQGNFPAPACLPEGLPGFVPEYLSSPFFCKENTFLFKKTQ
jgi:hypothetical protein